MSVTVEIQGLRECNSVLTNMPDAALKLIKKAMQEASKPVARNIRSAVDIPHWRKLVKAKVTVGRSAWEGTQAAVGMFNNGKVTNSAKGKDRADWFKAYWANYGTLSRRDPQHPFKNAIKAKKRHQSVGQPPQNFFERGSDGQEQIFLRQFEDYFTAHQDELVKR